MKQSNKKKNPINTIVRATFCGALLLAAQSSPAKEWTLKQCIDYALQNNISLLKTRVQHQSAIEDWKQSKAALLPSLSASTSQNVSYNPWPETGSFTVAGSKVQTNVDKVYYNGSYSVMANWTVWDGNVLRNTEKLNKLTAEQAGLDSAVTANSIQEQIAQLFVQILYSKEAIEVNKHTLETSKKNEERGKEFLKVGSMSKADVAQLTAQRAQDEFALVQAESNLRDYKRQLKQLLQIIDDDDFDVAIPETTDAMALQEIPTVNMVYNKALATRPEIKNALLGLQSSDLQLKIAKAGKLPLGEHECRCKHQHDFDERQQLGTTVEKQLHFRRWPHAEHTALRPATHKDRRQQGHPAKAELSARLAQPANNAPLHHRELLAAGHQQPGAIQKRQDLDRERAGQLRVAERAVQAELEERDRTHERQEYPSAGSAE